MEKLKVKHDHKLTDILKVGIFAIFLLLPFLTYAPTGLYYGFNEQAQAQERIEQEPNYYSTNEVINANDLIISNAYLWTDNFSTDIQTTNDILRIFIDKDTFENFYPNKNYEDATTFYLGFWSGHANLKLIEGSAWTANKNLNNISFKFLYLGVSDSPQYVNDLIPSISTCDDYIKEYQDVVYTMSISDSMYSGWQGMWQTPFYNWTNNSILKTGLDNFTGVFGVNNQSYITNLITYEVIMVAIYIVIDIVLTMFKWLTHMVGSKE